MVDISKHRQLKLPRKVNLGAGYIVSVILASPTAIAEIMDDEHDPELPYKGAFDWENMTILINKNLPADEKRDIFWHEVIHAVNDIKDYDRDFFYKETK